MSEIRQKLGFDAQQAIATLSKLSSSLEGASKSLRKMDAAASGTKSLAKVTKQTKEASKASADLVVGWKTLIRVLSTQLIVRGLNTIITGLKDAVENARELGLAIEEVRTIDAAGRTAQDISEQVLALSDAIGKAPTDLAEGLYQALSNQVVEAGESFQFMSEAARLAKVTASETGDAVNALSSVMNSYNLAASEAEHVSGTLFATVEQGRLRLSEIANVIGRVTPLTAQLGITWEETAASIATMTRQGVRADTAITQLRAVVTRLLKPTAEMSAIFRKWGVEDGRQAVLTFGGLTGVLKKLAQETGHNSGEMAELLRNVRAIAGVFGIMSNEGKTMEEVLNSITTATTKATEAWSEFSKSDAQRLTVEMQKFDNSLTRLGTTSIPTVIKTLDVVNLTVEGVTRTVQMLTGNWEMAEQAALEYGNAVAKGAADGLKTQQAWAEASEGAYDGLAAASRLYYAEANKLEQALATTRDNAITSATAAFENVANRLTSVYSDNLKKIQDFSDDAAGNVEKAFGRLEDILRDIDDRTLEHRLKSTDSNYKKLLILNDAYVAALKKRSISAAAISADPSTIKQYQDDQKVVIGLLDRRGQRLDSMGASSEEINKNFKEVVKQQRQAGFAEVEFAKQSKLVELTSGGSADNFAETAARAKQIVERMKEIRADGKVTLIERSELATLKAELDRVNEKAKEAAKTFQDMGLDIDFSSMIDGLSGALNEAHKDWDAEADRAEAVFAQRVIPLQISLDPGGALAEFQKRIGQQQAPGQSTASFAAKGDAAATKLLQDDLNTTAEIAVLREQGIEPLEKASNIIRKMVQDNGKMAEQGLRQLDLSNDLFTIWLGLAGVRAEEAGQAALSVSAAGQMLTSYGSILATLKEEKIVEDGLLAGVQKRSQAALDAGLISQDQFDTLAKIGKQLSENVLRVQQMVDLEKQRRPEEELEAAHRLNETKKEIADQNLTEVQIREELEGTEKVLADLLNEMKQNTEGTSNAAEQTNKGLGAASTQAGNITTNVKESTGALGDATAQAGELRGELEGAARAAAAISSAGGSSGDGSSQYHGGPHYAAGGPFRGQDRQLTALARGETVVNRKNSSRFFSELNAMNQGSQPVYREQGGPVTNVGDVNVTVKGGDSSQQTVREIGHALRREIKRGNLKLR